MVNDEVEIRCARCGRKLKDPKSIERGMGKTCYKKFLQEMQRLKGVYNDSEKASQEESEKAAS